jgi:hypothetical protein
MEDVVIRQSKRKLIKLIVLNIFILAICLLCILIGTFEHELFPLVIGIIGLTFFGFCFLFFIQRLMRPKEILIINDNGIIDHSSATSIGAVSWEEIDSFYRRNILSNSFICVKLKDENQTLSRLKPWKIRLLKLNTPVGCEPVSITLDTADAEFTSVLNTLQRKLQEYNEKQTMNSYEKAE